jgi:class 3 adenylate cyclase
MLFQFLTRSVSKLSGKVLSSIVLALPFALLALVGYLSYTDRQKDIKNLATQLRSEITDRIEDNVKFYLETPHKVNQANANAIESDLFDLEDFQDMESFFSKQLQNSKEINNTYVGNVKGDMFGAEWQQREKNNLRLIINESTAEKFNSTISRRVLEDYDPRRRPWYQLAKKKGEPTWSDVYTDFSSGKTVVTAAYPVYDKSGKLVAVLGSDFLACEVNEFLRRLKNDKLEIGGLFITDRSGKPLAKSTGNQCTQIEPNQVLKSEDDFIRGTVKYLEKKFGDLSKIDRSNPLEFELNGDRQFIQVTPLTDDYGLDWLIVVVIPENTVIEQINANTRTSIWLYSTALGMATAVVILSFHWTRLRAENAHLQHLAQLKDEFLAAASRFVPRDFLDFLGKSIIDVELGDQVRKEMTIMFSDIRSFTTMSEKMSPQENFNFINDYLGKVSPAIRNQGGIIDKYIGDAIMALFPQQSAEAALQAAIEMQREVSIYNEHRLKNGYQPIAIGVGLHTGILRLGTIGEPERMETTVISDAVNLASRLEGLTKLYGAGILISGETLFKLPPSKYSYRWLGQVKVKGRDESVSVFEVYDAEPATIVELKNKTKTAFETSLLLYSQKNFAQANQIFQEILQINPQDRAAKMYIERCEYYQEHEVPEEWSRMEDFNLVKQ